MLDAACKILTMLGWGEGRDLAFDSRFRPGKLLTRYSLNATGIRNDQEFI